MLQAWLSLKGAAGLIYFLCIHKYIERGSKKETHEQERERERVRENTISGVLIGVVFEFKTE